MPDNTDYLQGIIERLTFHSEETGYTVARLKVPKAQDLITVVGNFANIQAGQTLALEGTWRSPKIITSQWDVHTQRAYQSKTKKYPSQPQFPLPDIPY